MIALTHVPSPNMDQGQRTHVARVPIDYDVATRQHDLYCRTLRDCGANVITLDVNRDMPDSTFIEDAAVVLDDVAVLASMGTEARRCEMDGIEQALSKYRDVQRSEQPASLEGSEVVRDGHSL